MSNFSLILLISLFMIGSIVVVSYTIGGTGHSAQLYCVTKDNGAPGSCHPH